MLPKRAPPPRGAMPHPPRPKRVRTEGGKPLVGPPEVLPRWLPRGRPPHRLSHHPGRPWVLPPPPPRSFRPRPRHAGAKGWAAPPVPRPGRPPAGPRLPPPPRNPRPEAPPVPPLPQRHTEPVAPLPRRPRGYPALNLEPFSLPDVVHEAYSKKGIKSLHAFQHQCLTTHGGAVLRGEENIVYSAPTSGGKTLVAEVLALKRLLEHPGKGKVVFVVPYISLVAELVDHLSEANTSLTSTTVAVCTVEKAASFINGVLLPEPVAAPKRKPRVVKPSDLVCLVVDEVHLLAEAKRGVVLELLLTKFKRANPKAQIVAMSATVSNLPMLASWLGGVHFEGSGERPVELRERVVVGAAVIDRAHLGELHPGGEDVRGDPLTHFHLDSIRHGTPTLTFCCSKATCVGVAKKAAAAARGANPYGQHPPAVLAARRGVLAKLAQLPAGLCPVLKATVPQGVAYHNAGLTTEERAVVEAAFREGALTVLTATTTLAVGVNLPAARVIIHPSYGTRFIDGIKYRQMAGRAGRAGKAATGEAIIVTSPSSLTLAHARDLLEAPLPPVTSAILPPRAPDSDDAHLWPMRRVVLEAVTSGLATTHDACVEFVLGTLCAKTTRGAFGGHVDAALRWLQGNKFITRLQQPVRPEHQPHVCTQMGRASFVSGLEPRDTLEFEGELRTARHSGFILTCDLHLLYLLTPVFHGIKPPKDDDGGVDPRHVLAGLEPELKGVAKHLGIHLTNPAVTSPTFAKFYAALALHKFQHEADLQAVSTELGVPRGALQALQRTAAQFYAMAVRFCQEMNWAGVVASFKALKYHLTSCAQPALKPLLRLAGMTYARARCLFKNRIRSVEAIARTDVGTLKAVLRQCVRFQLQADAKVAAATGTAGYMTHMQDLAAERAAAAMCAQAKAMCEVAPPSAADAAFKTPARRVRR